MQRPELLEPFIRTTTLLFVLLNPFLMVVYLLDLVRSLDTATFRRVLSRGAMISLVVFVAFASAGDRIFDDVLHVRFASFLLFGGLIFVIIGLRFALRGSDAIAELRGPAEHVAHSVAMPFMIGPGTVSASILTGARLPLPLAVGSIFTALVLTVCSVIVLKSVHDRVHRRYETLTNRYIDIVGRISALVVGTIAVEMLVQGVELVIGLRREPFAD